MPAQVAQRAAAFAVAKPAAGVAAAALARPLPRPLPAWHPLPRPLPRPPPGERGRERVAGGAQREQVGVKKSFTGVKSGSPSVHILTMSRTERGTSNDAACAQLANEAPRLVHSVQQRPAKPLAEGARAVAEGRPIRSRAGRARGALVLPGLARVHQQHADRSGGRREEPLLRGDARPTGARVRAVGLPRWRLLQAPRPVSACWPARSIPREAPRTQRGKPQQVQPVPSGASNAQTHWEACAHWRVRCAPRRYADLEYDADVARVVKEMNPGLTVRSRQARRAAPSLKSRAALPLQTQPSCGSYSEARNPTHAVWPIKGICQPCGFTVQSSPANEEQQSG